MMMAPSCASTAVSPGEARSRAAGGKAGAPVADQEPADEDHADDAEQRWRGPAALELRSLGRLLSAP